MFGKPEGVLTSRDNATFLAQSPGTGPPCHSLQITKTNWGNPSRTQGCGSAFIFAEPDLAVFFLMQIRIRNQSLYQCGFGSSLKILYKIPYEEFDVDEKKQFNFPS